MVKLKNKNGIFIEEINGVTCHKQWG